jgi:hypothetical protein
VTIADQNHVASPAAVTAVGAALLNRLLATKRNDTVSAASASNMNDRFVDKHRAGTSTNSVR